MSNPQLPSFLAWHRSEVRVPVEGQSVAFCVPLLSTLNFGIIKGWQHRRIVDSNGFITYTFPGALWCEVPPSHRTPLYYAHLTQLSYHSTRTRLPDPGRDIIIRRVEHDDWLYGTFSILWDDYNIANDEPEADSAASSIEWKTSEGRTFTVCAADYWSYVVTTEFSTFAEKVKQSQLQSMGVQS